MHIGKYARLWPLGLWLLLASLNGVAPSRAAPSFTNDVIYALTTTNHLLHFESATPGTILDDVAISGLQTGENILAIDFRPATNELYGLGSTSRLYRIDRLSGLATEVGSGPFSPALSGVEYGFDFNPAVDLIRVVGNDDQNFRLNPTTGTVAGTDTPVAFAPTDVYSQSNAVVVASAYLNNRPGATLTTLYDYEFTNDVLVTQGGINSAPSPNTGQLFTVGSSGVTTCDTLQGLDIAAGGQAYASLNVQPNCGVTRLFTVNLSSGAVTPVGDIGGGVQIRDIAVALPYVVYMPVVER